MLAAACVAAALWLGVRAAAEPGRAAAGPATVVVERGDSLARIAARALGDEALWPALYRANRDRIKDPTRVYPGQVLSLPEPPQGPAPVSAGRPREEP
jgi:nucleoid-associated protein YgaU